MTDSKHPAKPILIIDDEEQFLFSMKMTLSSKGYNNVIECSNSRNVMNILDKNEYAVIIMDIMMPHMSGMDLLPEINAQFPEIPIIMVTAVNEVETAVDCLKKGAFDYVVKPIDDERLMTSIIHAIELREFRVQNKMLKESLLREGLEQAESFSHIITKNSRMIQLFKYIEAISVSSLPVLISGETGTGKELIAEAIHKVSGRKGDYITVNIAGLDDNLFSDTLFGHEKGAYTGANKDRKGLIEKAAGGTVFLDEIGDLSMESQVKLLRLLQERKYYQLGSDMYKISDARIICATNKDLSAEQSAGKFRSDLYYRLYTHQVRIPALRERKDDIEMLVDHFVDKACRDMKKKVPSIPKELYVMLKNYSFPGNVRELEGLIFDAVAVHKSGVMSLENIRMKLGVEEIDTIITMGDEMVFPEILPTMKDIENMIVDEAMKRADGNQTIAARMLGLTRQALNKRLSRRDKE